MTNVYVLRRRELFAKRPFGRPFRTNLREMGFEDWRRIRETLPWQVLNMKVVLPEN